MSTNAAKARETSDHRERQPKVLVADDHADSLAIVTETLTQIGCSVLCAKDGQDGLMKFRRHQPEFAVLDVRMPRMGGLDLCREIKTLAPQTPVVLVTADAEFESRVAGYEAGADEYIVKPFFPPELQARFRVLLRQKETQDALVREYERVNRLRDFLPPAVVEAVLGDAGTVPVAAPKRKNITVAQVDIRNFTRLADQLEPEDLRMLLDVYISEMSEAVVETGGTINRFLGDRILAIFNDPVELTDHVECGVRAAMEMCVRSRAIEAGLQTMLPEPFAIGIGLHTGFATVGRLGRGRYGDYTAVGSVVELAGRVQVLSLPNRVTATGAVLEALGSRAQLANDRRETMRGLAEPVRVAEIVALR